MALNSLGGWRSTTTLFLAGLDIEEKAALVEQALWSGIPGGPGAFDEVEVQLLRTDKSDPVSNEEAMAQLRITVKDRDESKVGRTFSVRVTELALSSYPGLFGAGLTADPQAYGRYWPTSVPASLVRQEVMIAGERIVVEPVLAPDPEVVVDVPLASTPSTVFGPVVRAPLRRVFGARSGDKGGDANVGVWAPSDEAFAWLDSFLTVDRLKDLLPEASRLPVKRYPLPNLRSLNFVIAGLLGGGVATSSRLDPQAKSLGEWLRARIVELPEELLV